MKNKVESIEKLINSFTKLPAVGQKTAERYAYAIINMDIADVKEFADNLIKAKQDVKLCKVCGNWSEGDVCDFCSFCGEYFLFDTAHHGNFTSQGDFTGHCQFVAYLTLRECRSQCG